MKLKNILTIALIFASASTTFASQSHPVTVTEQLLKRQHQWEQKKQQEARRKAIEFKRYCTEKVNEVGVQKYNDFLFGASDETIQSKYVGERFYYDWIDCGSKDSFDQKTNGVVQQLKVLNPTLTRGQFLNQAEILSMGADLHAQTTPSQQRSLNHSNNTARTNGNK